MKLFSAAPVILIFGSPTGPFGIAIAFPFLTKRQNKKQ